MVVVKMEEKRTRSFFTVQNGNRDHHHGVSCCGFVYSINIADSLISCGRYRTIGVIGADTMSTITDYTDRTLSILFGDAAGAVVVARDDDPSLGCLYQTMHADAALRESLYIPRREQDIPDHDRDNPIRLGCLRMRGREIFKFAVIKMREVIEEALEATGLSACQISRLSPQAFLLGITSTLLLIVISVVETRLISCTVPSTPATAM